MSTFNEDEYVDCTCRLYGVGKAKVWRNGTWVDITDRIRNPRCPRHRVKMSEIKQGEDR